MSESAIFTAIPAGRLDDGRRLKVTVFVTPKLDVAGLAAPGDLVELGAYEAFGNWPRTVRDARFVFEIAGFGQVEGTPLDDPITPDPQLWDALFGRTSVGDAGFQHFEDATVHSYPVAEVARAVTGLYQLIAVASPTDFPAITRGPLRWAQDTLASPTSGGDEIELGHRRALKRTFGDLRNQSDRRGRYVDLDRAVSYFAAQGQTVDPGAIALAAAESFYARDIDPLDDTAATAPPPDPVPPEFHSFVARCADYPELLRHLGLAFDLWIDDDDGIAETTTIRVLDGANGDPLESLLAPVQSRPLTLLHRTDRFWAPAGYEEPDIRDGSLVVDDTRRFSIEQIDPDGAALKVASLIAQLQRTTDDLEASARANNNAPSMTADASSLPALKSAGLLIARRDRARGMVQQFDQSARHEQERAAAAPEPVLLSVTDVTRGWRVDISDEASGDRSWHSLHERTGVYELVDPGQPAQPLPVQPAPDEAYLKAASTSSTGSAPKDDQYLHESVAGWDGWSLAVQRPGRLQTETGTVPANDEPEVAATGFPLAAHFGVTRGSLPRLRFGRHYRVRVRAVDLSGQSIPDAQLDEAHERDLGETYQRWEPVPSPAIIPLTEYTEGESLMRMVVRSTLDVAVDDYIALDRVRGLAGHEASGDLGIVYRAENERHLVAPIAGVQLAETHGMFDAALAGDPAAVAAQFTVAAKESGSYLTLAGARVVNPSDPAAATVLDGSKDQALAQGEYIVHNTHALTLPYLPDPLARGLSFTTLPGDDADNPPTRLLRWPGDPDVWHDRRPVLLRIAEGDGAPVFDSDSRTLVVSLPKATLRTVRVSSFLDERDPDIMRVWNLIEASQSPASAAQRQQVREGRHWMITPYTELTLVHAVEKPLAPPAIVLDPQEQRWVGETFSFLRGAVHNHAASTGRIDIDAVWTDPVDDVLAPAPSEVEAYAHVADFQLEANETEALVRRDGGPAGGPYGPRHEARHEFGDTKHRYVDYTATATTRFREYFPPEITDRAELITSAGESLLVNVKSSARPEPPDVRYIVPTWEWSTEQLDVDSPLAVRRVRSGGGLRVYLGRPWYSSGPDELLGVVLRIQPWITWPLDVGRGVLGTVESQALADGWARQVLERNDARVTDAAASVRLAEHLTSAAGRRRDIRGDGDVRLRRAAARTADDRFLRAADAAVSAAREADATLRAGVHSAASSAVLADYLGLFLQTGPEGRRFTTAWGADPVFRGEPVASGPFIHQFPLHTAVGGRVRLSELDDSVTVVGHQPEFDPERKLWFCDLQLDAGDAYTPFVKLALVRYQPHSLADQEISKAVMADFVQLLPRREATFVVDPERRAIVVTLAGAVGVPAHAATLPNLASRIDASRRVEAWIERLPAGSASDLDWVAVGAPERLDVHLTLSQLRSEDYADVEWAGLIGHPEVGAGDRLRVRIAEYELHRADALGVPIVAAVMLRDRRLVYADSVDLPPA